MNKPDQSALIKTCSSCGLQKPLSAFLQLAGPQGSTYGNMCSDCRKAGLDKLKEKFSESERGTTGETGKTIDTKSKMHSDIDNREQAKKVEVEYHKERDLDDALSMQTIEKKDFIASQEKQHRTSFLNVRSTLNSDKKAESKSFADKTKHKEKTILVAHNIKEDVKKTTIDHTVAEVGQQMGVKYHSAERLKTIAAMFGKGSAAAKQVAKALKSPEEFGIKPANNAEEFIEKNWQGPSGGKRR